MGEVMAEAKRILVTGASGFVGRSVIEQAVAQGHTVVALHRRALPDLKGRKNVKLVRCDLSAPNAVSVLRSALLGVDGVIHAAAHLGDKAGVHERDTEAATAHVLEALKGHPATFVLVSSIAVYDTERMREGDDLTEDSPLIDVNAPRDPYAGAKLMQEAMVLADGRPAWLMRPGAIWGRGRTWHALNGPKFGKLFVTVTSDGVLPLTHVAATARALVAAAATPVSTTTAVNVFDDDLPTRSRFVAAHKEIAGWPRLTRDVSWSTWKGVCRAASLWSGRPGLLRLPIAMARLMPMGYPNTRLRGLLGGADTAPFEDVLRASMGGVE